MRTWIFINYLVVMGLLLWDYHRLPEEPLGYMEWCEWRVGKRRCRDPVFTTLAVAVVSGIALGLLTSEGIV